MNGEADGNKVWDTKRGHFRRFFEKVDDSTLRNSLDWKMTRFYMSKQNLIVNRLLGFPRLIRDLYYVMWTGIVCSLFRLPGISWIHSRVALDM